jgi:hypothetical protein
MLPPTTLPDVLGLLAVLAVMAAVACMVSYSRLPRELKLLVYAALALRVVGSWVRYWVYFGFYDGIGDPGGYYGRGLRYAERFREFDFSPFFDPTLWFRGQWWGTSFVSFPSGVILSGIGPSFLGEFLAFSLMAFLGLVCFAVAFHWTYPQVPVARYARWIWLFPSLWYWPSSVGKDAIVLMGLGLAVAGFVGREKSVNWALLIVGMFFVFAIRPQVAAVTILSFILAHWLARASRWTIGTAVQGALILGVGLGGMWLAMRYIGVQGFDTEGVQGYMETMSSRSAIGGSKIAATGVRLTGVPLALVNVLMRPFIWEAHNLMVLLSALEIVGFWAIVWYRRRDLVAALRVWRSRRFLRLAVPFILFYTIALGLIIANLGILARQRIFLFPFLFVLLEAEPELKRKRSLRPRSGFPIQHTRSPLLAEPKWS